MSIPRQDAWTKEEDRILAETVLQYIREGKTQLEAFKKVAETLSRTPAACGFRWNATIRKQYVEDIQLAKQERKLANHTKSVGYSQGSTPDHETIDNAIMLLQRLKLNSFEQGESELIKQLQEENKRLKKELLRYEQAWKEVHQLLDSIKKNAKQDETNAPT